MIFHIWIFLAKLHSTLTNKNGQDLWDIHHGLLVGDWWHPYYVQLASFSFHFPQKEMQKYLRRNKNDLLTTRYLALKLRSYFFN